MSKNAGVAVVILWPIAQLWYMHIIFINKTLILSDLNFRHHTASCLFLLGHKIVQNEAQQKELVEQIQWFTHKELVYSRMNQCLGMDWLNDSLIKTRKGTCYVSDTISVFERISQVNGFLTHSRRQSLACLKMCLALRWLEKQNCVKCVITITIFSEFLRVKSSQLNRYSKRNRYFPMLILLIKWIYCLVWKRLLCEFSFIHSLTKLTMDLLQIKQKNMVTIVKSC